MAARHYAIQASDGRLVHVSIDHYIRAVAVADSSVVGGAHPARYVFSLDRVAGCEAEGVHGLRSELTSTWASLAGPLGGRRLAINECGERRCGPREAFLFDVVARPAPESGGSEDPDDAFAGAQAYIYFDRNPISLCADGRLAATRIDLVAEGSRPELFTLVRASVALDAADAHGAATDEWEMVSLSRAERRLTSHIVGTWENQTWAPMRGWTPSVEKPPAWSDISGRQVLPLGSFELGPAWTWESEWAADLSAGAPKSDGWSYATGFELSSPGGTDWGAKSMRSMVRRRRWVRYRQRPSRALGDDGWSTSGAAATEVEHDKWGRAWNGGCGVGEGASSPKTAGAASDAARTTEWALEDFYRRVGEPGKLEPGKIATLRRRYAGREKELVQGLWTKYGCVPEVDPHPPAPALPPRARERGGSRSKHARLLSVGASAGQGVRSEADHVVRGIGNFLRTVIQVSRVASFVLFCVVVFFCCCLLLVLSSVSFFVL